MLHRLVPDTLWTLAAPLLPPRAIPRNGTPGVDDRAALAGIIYVLKTGCSWRMLALNLGFGSGVTCWRRLRDWQAAGVWRELHLVLLDHLAALDALDWSRASLDSASIRAVAGGDQTGANPTDRGKRGTKRHLVVDANGMPLAVTLTAANVHDSKALEAAVDAIGSVRNGRRGRPKRRPAKLHCDKGFDYERCRKALSSRSIQPRIARRGVASSERLGRHRWVVERTLAWLNGFRRLRVRYERCAALHLALTLLACALVCFRRLEAR